MNIPTKLTHVRLIIAPLFLPFLFYWLLPYNNLIINIFLALFFIALSFTDMLDGYFARRLGQESKIGGLLDPIADKFLIFSTLVSLLAVDKIFFYWVVLFIGRELFVTGLRLISCECGYSIHVSYLAKVKTSVQYLFLTWVIVNPYQAFGIYAQWWNGGEWLLLFLSLVLSLFTAYQYYRFFIVGRDKESNEV